MTGWRTHLETTVDVPNFTSMLAKMVRGFVVGNLIVGALMAAVMVGVLYALKVPGAVPLGIASGFLNLVPFLGAILAAGLPLFASIFQFDSPAPFALIVVAAVALHIVSANFLVPKLIGSRVNIGPVAATMGMLFWGWLWGIMGVLLGRPVDGFCKARRRLSPLADSHLQFAGGEASRRAALGAGRLRTRRSCRAISRETPPDRRKRLIARTAIYTRFPLKFASSNFRIPFSLQFRPTCTTDYTSITERFPPACYVRIR